MRSLKFAELAALCLISGVIHAETINTILPDSTSIKWVKATEMPPGAEFAVLAGDPSKNEAFVARLKLPASYTVPVHSHPINEYDTVISGTFFVGAGDNVDAANTQAMPVGSFIAIPAQVKHFGITKEATILQINGVGPWGMIYPKKN
jgi:quercetin dioxygenase-like cupin family protein